MSFEHSDESRMLVDTVTQFVSDRLKPLEAEVDLADDFDVERMAALRKEVVALGLYGYNLPEAIGGPGLSLLTQSAIDEAIGHTSMPLGEVFGRLPGSLLFATEDQRSWFVEPLLSGEKSIGYALTEPGAGSDLSAIATRAVRVAGGWQLNGSKHFISNVEHADYIIVLAASDPDAPLKSKLSTFIVERGNPGLTFERRFRKMGWHGYPISAFSLDDCFVPDSHLLGGPGQGFKTMMATINNERVYVASKCLGMAQELMDLVIPWARERKTFGQRLGDHQAIQFYLADCDVELNAARLLTRQAAVMGDENHPDFRIAASRAKLYASEMLGRVADRVLQIFGGAGFMTDLPVERIYRDARAFRIGEGTSEMQRLQIARHLLAN
jgi:alkylation response protein AidB-like acyl-CoA dehydrogenase